MNRLLYQTTHHQVAKPLICAVHSASVQKTSTLASFSRLRTDHQSSRRQCCSASSSTGTTATDGSQQASLLKQHPSSDSMSLHSANTWKTYELVSEEQAYGRYLSVYNRQVKVTCQDTGKAQEVAYDVVGHPRCNFMSVTVLPFHQATNGSEPQFTLIREYCQGPNKVCYNVPSGGYDPKKHKSLAECAEAELSEEALLKGGTLVQLAPPDHPGFYEVKWCQNRFMPFLVINPQEDPNPGSRDLEEHIQVVRVSLSQAKQLAADGEFMLPSMMTIKLAIERLQSLGLVQ